MARPNASPAGWNVCRALADRRAEFWRAVWMYRCRQASVAVVLGLSWIGHVGFVFAFWCMRQCPVESGTGDRFRRWRSTSCSCRSAWSCRRCVPTPGGAGGGEWGFGGLYKVFGGSEVNGVLGSLVQRVISWVLGLIGYLVYLRMRPRCRPALRRTGRAESGSATRRNRYTTARRIAHPSVSETFTAR